MYCPRDLRRDLTGYHKKMSFKLPDIVSYVLHSHAPTIIDEILRTQVAAIIWNYLREYIEDVFRVLFRVKCFEIVRRIVTQEVDEIVKGLACSVFPPKPREWLHNGIVGTVSAVVRHGIAVHTWLHNIVSNTPGEIIMVTGAPEPSSPPGSSADYDDPPPLSLHINCRGHLEDRRRDRSRSKSSDRTRNLPPHVPKVENRHHKGRDYMPPLGHDLYDDNYRLDDYCSPGDDRCAGGGRLDDDYHRHDEKRKYDDLRRHNDNRHRDEDRRRDKGCGRDDDRSHGDDIRHNDENRPDNHQRHDDIGQRLSNFAEMGDDGGRDRNNAENFSYRTMTTKSQGTRYPAPDLFRIRK